MSQSSSGLISAVARKHPGNLQELEQTLMLKSDHNAPNAASIEPEAPGPSAGVLTMATPAAEPTLAAGEPRNRRKGASDLAPAAVPTKFDQLASQVRATGEKHVLHTRVPDWVDRALNQKLHAMKGNDGTAKISKEAVVTLALIQFLDLQPPDGWRPF